MNPDHGGLPQNDFPDIIGAVMILQHGGGDPVLFREKQGFIFELIIRRIPADEAIFKQFEHQLNLHIIRDD
ncbi:MAG: hypothetical protein ABTB30_11640 [Clostridia bacterium]